MRLKSRRYEPDFLEGPLVGTLKPRLEPRLAYERPPHLQDGVLPESSQLDGKVVDRAADHFVKANRTFESKAPAFGSVGDVGVVEESEIEDQASALVPLPILGEIRRSPGVPPVSRRLLSTQCPIGAVSRYRAPERLMTSIPPPSSGCRRAQPARRASFFSQVRRRIRRITECGQHPDQRQCCRTAPQV